MCEFCSNPFDRNNNRDAQHVEFAGFFSAEAIDAAIRQTQQRAREEKNDEDSSSTTNEEDSDGT